MGCHWCLVRRWKALDEVLALSTTVNATLAGTVAAYMYWLFDEGDLEFAMSGLRNARLLQIMWAMQLHQLRCGFVFPQNARRCEGRGGGSFVWISR
jgi:hypothetical protein